MELCGIRIQSFFEHLGRILELVPSHGVAPRKIPERGGRGPSACMLRLRRGMGTQLPLARTILVGGNDVALSRREGGSGMTVLISPLRACLALSNAVGVRAVQNPCTLPAVSL